MACNWLITMSSHCPNLVRIGCNACFLSHITVYGVQLDPIGIALNEIELHQHQLVWVSASNAESTSIKINDISTSPTGMMSY